MNVNANSNQVDIRIAKAELTARAENFESEVTPHLAVMRNIAVRISPNSMDAEDLVQDTLARAFRFWDSYEPNTNCRAWLLHIMRNQYINEYRVKSRRPKMVSINALDESDLPLRSNHNAANRTPEEIVLEKCLGDDLLAAIERLRDKVRQIVIFFYLRGHSSKQIADVEKLNVGTVKSRLYRSRKWLRAGLKDYAGRKRHVSVQN